MSKSKMDKLVQMYMGCGFHYSLEQQLGGLIKELAMPVQWCANHCAKIPDDRLRLIGLQVSMMMLTQSVVEAEKSRSKLLKTNQI